MRNATNLQLPKEFDMKVIVETVLTQELEVPDDWNQLDVSDFLAACQSFRTAFRGLSNVEQTAQIVDIDVVDERITEMGDEAYDE